MTIYHQVAWNYGLSGSDISHCAEIGQALLTPYIDAGYCSTDRTLWDWNGNVYVPQPGVPIPPGIYVSRRIWTDFAQCQAYCSEANNIRLQDAICAAVISELTAHNDNNYNTAPV